MGGEGARVGGDRPPRVQRFVALSLVLFACERPAPPPLRDPSQADLALTGVTIRSYTRGELQVVTTAQKLDAFREVGTPGDLLALDAGILLVRDGTRLTAPMVRGNFLSGQLEGSGGVAMVGPKGMRGATERVAFDRTQGTAGVASSDAGVSLTQPGSELRASGFTADLADEHVTFDDATTRFQPAR
jgi:hypothetical protein